jgi:hypothetical protein
VLDQSGRELEEEWKWGEVFAKHSKGIASTNLLYKRESNVKVQGLVIWCKEINHSSFAKRCTLRKGGAFAP